MTQDREDGSEGGFGLFGSSTDLAAASGEPTEGDDTLSGDELPNQIDGLGGDDKIYGRKGFDQLDGGAGDDTLSGGQFGDVLSGGGGADLLLGGRGFDTASYIETRTDLFINLETGATAGGAAGDVLTSIEHLSGGRGDDRLIGSSGFNDIDGDKGEDTILGQDGDDRLTGQAGNDLVNGGAGEDLVFGEEAEDSLLGGADGDAIYGNKGDDTLLGGSGDDYLSGGQDSDRMYGGAGSDVLVGGQDEWTDFGARDVFDYNDVSESTADAMDDVGGSFGNEDRFDFSDIDAREGDAGSQGFEFIGDGAFTAEGQVRIVTGGENETFVEVNVSGADGAEMVILVRGDVDLTAEDFILD